MHGALLWLTPLLLSLSVLSEQVPPDPDEPFFILSLTEIPVCSSGEVVGGASEPLPYLPVTDASMRQQRLVPFISWSCRLRAGVYLVLFGVRFYNFLHPSAVFLGRVWQQWKMGLSLMSLCLRLWKRAVRRASSM